MDSRQICMGCMKSKGDFDVCPHCGWAEGTPPKEEYHLFSRTTLAGRYIVGRVIGYGGFGVTYLAWDDKLGIPVAVKEFFPSGLLYRVPGKNDVTVYGGEQKTQFLYGLERFIEEARNMAKFNRNPNIVSVSDFFEENNTAYIVMEYLEGEDLLEHIKRRGGKIGWEDTLTLLTPMMDALTALHAEGLIHRDISPDNIFITKEGKTKLLDFGTARFAMGEKSKSLSVILKPGYAPPEQYSSRGKQGPWTDVYALAATVYRCVTGQAPVDAVDRQMGTALEPPASLGANIPKIAENVLMGALALEPDKRIQTVGDLKWQLEQQQPAAPQAHVNIDGYNPAGSASSQAADHRDEEYQEAIRRADEEKADIRKKRRSIRIGACVVVSIIIIALIVGQNRPTATTEESFSIQQPSVETTVAELVSLGTADVKIGVILVHDKNTDYDTAHIKGIKNAAKAIGIADDQIIWKYNVAENEACYGMANDLVEQGCTYIFSDSYGHQSYMQQAASEYEDVTFISITGDTAALSGLSNFKNAFNDTYQSRYVSGVVAGMKLAELVADGKVKDKNMDADGNIKLGYVGAFPYAEVVSGYTSFYLGVKYIVDNVVMDVQYTYSWYDPIAEAEAANALVSSGCIILGQHADSTGAPAACEALLEGGTTVYCVGYNIDMRSIAPKAALTSAQNDWSVYYTYVFNCIKNGEEIATDWAEGYNEGAVMISTLGESCTEGTAEKVAEVVAALKDGSLNVFDCSTFTVGGKHISSYTDSYGMNGAECIQDGVFTESTLRSAPYFDLRIDGITEVL